MARVTGALLVILMVAACGGDDAGGDTMGETTATVGECAIVKNYLVTAADYGGDGQLIERTAAEIIEAMSGEELGDADLEGILGHTFGDIGFWQVDGVDVPTKVAALQDDGVRAAPIHLVAPMGHWAWAPGEPPMIPPPDSPAEPEVASLAELDGTVFVIDTGWERGGPDWMAEPFVSGDDERFNPGQGSHGTFVASIIRQVSPQTRVRILAPEVVPESESTWIHPQPASVPPLTSEINVLGAIVRARLESDDTARALNMSIGTYACEMPRLQTVEGGTDFGATPTLRNAVGDWRARHPDAPVIAAAGNEENGQPFYPAALPGVVGVAARPFNQSSVNSALVWDPPEGGQRGEADPKSSADILAPGEDLLGYSPRFTQWSGSSFAAPVVAGLVANNPGNVAGVLATKNVDYMVPGLSHGN